MRIAYIVSAYRYAGQLARLIHRLQDPGTSFLVHIDRKSPIQDEVAARVDGVPGLQFLKRHRCVWGGFGHVAATLEGIRAICDGRVACDYVVLLTGQDYPLKSNEVIRDTLRKADGRAFMEHFPLPTEHWEGGGLDRVLRRHVRWLGRHVVFPRGLDSPFVRRFPMGLQPFGGSSYWCLPRDCVEYIGAFVRRHPRFVRFFRYADVPDEIMFQTILLNSSLRDRVVDDNLRHVEWPDATSGSPAVLTTDDFDALAASPKLFARKFDVTVDATILDLVDARLLGVIAA